MAVAFSTSDDLLQLDTAPGTVDAGQGALSLLDDWTSFLEIPRCTSWINEHGYKRVALQFPDAYLQKSASVAELLTEQTSAEVFILADTSYGSCCVDEVAAEHYCADAVIHYGHSCLSAGDRLPLLAVYGRAQVDVGDCVRRVLDTIPSTEAEVAVISAVQYDHCKHEVLERLKPNFKSVIVPELKQMSEGPRKEDKITDTKSIFEIFGRTLKLEASKSISDYTILYIGEDSMFLTNLMLTCKDSTFYSYKPSTKTCQKETIAVSRLLMKRFYLVEKVKDSSVVGILVATLSVSKYLDIVRRLKQLLTHAGKKYYVFSVGKINVAKLANFPDVDLYVLVSCPESVILDSAEFYRPIVTPFEVELACDPDRTWTGDVVLDYRRLLAEGDAYQPVDWDQPVCAVDVSLITGGVRQMGHGVETDVEGGGGSLVARDPMALSAVSGIDHGLEGVVALPTVQEESGNDNSTSERFTSHSWQGLDPQLGQTEVTKAVQGRKGIAIQYEEEPA